MRQIEVPLALAPHLDPPGLSSGSAPDFHIGTSEYLTLRNLLPVHAYLHEPL